MIGETGETDAGLSASAQVLAAGPAAWPEVVDGLVALLLVDRDVVAHVEAQPAAAIAAFQAAKARALIAHARRSSALWRERLPAEGEPRPWGELPILSRDDFRRIAAQGALEVPANRRPVRPNATTGSSGVPLGFHTCQVAARVNSANYLHQTRRQGVMGPGAWAYIGLRSDEHAGDHVETRTHPLLGGAVQYRRRARQFTVEQHARWLSGVGAAYLHTVPTVLRGMLDAYEAGVAAPRLKAVVAGAETVEPELRARARAVLGAPILDRYSCEEVGPLAYQCPMDENLHHVCVANAVVEVLDDDGAPARRGVPGRVVVTGLHTWAAPVIRYDIGDVAAQRQGCVCGFQGPVLETLLGRRRFLIRLPSGGHKFVGTAARPWLDIAPFVERRLVQTTPYELRAEVVLDRPITAEEKAAVAALLRREMGDELSYEVVQLDAIPWGPTGKRQDVVSLLE